MARHYNSGCFDYSARKIKLAGDRLGRDTIEISCLGVSLGQVNAEVFVPREHWINYLRGRWEPERLPPWPMATIIV